MIEKFIAVQDDDLFHLIERSNNLSMYSDTISKLTTSLQESEEVTTELLDTGGPLEFLLYKKVGSVQITQIITNEVVVTYDE